MIKRIAAITLLVLMMVMAASYPAQAIADPDSTPSINGVYVFENCLVSGDAGVLVDLNIEYASVPTEYINTSYMVVFMDSDGITPLYTVTPYPFVNKGYGHNLVWIYMSAEDVTTYHISSASSALYSVRIVGNPALSWTTDPPIVISGITVWQASGSNTETMLKTRVMGILDNISRDWLDASLITSSLILDTSTGFKLSSTGASFMATVIPYLGSIAPSCFVSSSIIPTPVNNDYTTGFGAVFTNLSGTAVGSPITLVDGSNTVAIGVGGTFTIELMAGTTGTATSGTGAVTGSPVTLVKGTNTITSTAGNITVVVSRTDTAGKANAAVVGTAFDLTAAATKFGMSRWMFSGIIWLFISVIICAALYRNSPSDNTQGTIKVVMLVFDVCIIGGTLLGMVHPIVGVLLFLGFSFLIGYVLFFQKSSV